MEIEQIYLGRVFEKLILRPLQLAYWAVAAYYLFSHAWLLGGGLILLSFVVAMIGAKLPHHKGQSAREIEEELATGIRTKSNREITEHEAGLDAGTALFDTAILLVFTAVILMWHYDFRWYWIVAGAIGTWFTAAAALFGAAALYGLVTRRFKPAN